MEATMHLKFKKHILFNPSVCLIVFLLMLLPYPVLAEEPADDSILATVNTVPIHQSELNKIISQYKKKSGKKTVSLDEKKQMLKNLTIRQLILQSHDAQAMEKESAFINKVAEFKKSLIISQFIKRHVEKQTPITNEELNNYYQNKKAQFSSEIEIEASVILLRTENDAKKIMEKLSAKEPFDTLARDHSIDLPSAKKGGSLGKVTRGSVFPEVWKELQKLAEGDVSDIVETKYGFNILTVQKIHPPEIKPFEAVKKEIKNALLPQKRENAYDVMVKTLEKNADLTLFENRLAGLEVNQ